jgi:hypothetical protein
MIAATRRRIARVRSLAAKRAGPALRRRRLVARVRLEALTRRIDRAVDRQLVRAWPALARLGRRFRGRALRWRRWAGRRARPPARLVFRALARLERALLRGRTAAVRAATSASGVLTPERGICLAILGAAACLAVAQFVDYRTVEIGRAGYASLPGANAPTTGTEVAGQAHAYLLVVVALLAAALAVAALPTAELPVSPDNREKPATRRWRRRRLGWLVFALGGVSLTVVLLVDLPAGQDAGAFSSRFSGATAVLLDGFYTQVAAAAGLMLGGMLLVLAPKAAARYHARPCRTRTNLFARVASALRRRRRRRASSRGRATRRGSRRRSGAASAPASPP